MILIPQGLLLALHTVQVVLPKIFYVHQESWQQYLRFLSPLHRLRRIELGLLGQLRMENRQLLPRSISNRSQDPDRCDLQLPALPDHQL